MLTKEYIQSVLMRNDHVGLHAIGRALVLLNARQTYDEQQCEDTKYHNDRGFTPADAKMGTSMARQYSRYKRLSDRQIAYWRKPNKRGTPRIAKYWRQLLEEAQKKQNRS